MRRLLMILGVGLIVPLGLLAVTVSFVRLNVSPSVPYGLYRLHAVTHPLTPGMLVVVDVPGWHMTTRLFLKPVAAVAGAWVCRVGQALVIHGADYGPIHETWRGSPLPSALAAETCAVVPPGHVFLATAAPQSLDSRYYGPVAVDQVTAIATPLLTWGPVHAATPLR